MMEKQTTITGSVSEGTMLLVNLFPKFVDVLEGIDPGQAEEFKTEYEEAIDDGEDLGYILDDLFDALDQIAPDGHYFGASTADRASYGFWPVEE